MSEALESVEQSFLANMAPYLDAFDAAILKSTEFVKAVNTVEDALDAMGMVAGASAAEVDAAMDKAVWSVEKLATAVAAMGKMVNIDVNVNGAAHLAALAATVDGLKDKDITVTVNAVGIAAANTEISSMSRRVTGLAGKVPLLVAELKLLDDELDKKKVAFAAAGAQVAALAAALALANGGIVKNTANTAAATRNTGMWVGGLRLTGQALHWIVMGSLEILSTAVPALVAFGAAGAGMYPTFVRIFDATNNLVTASGSYRASLLNSVGPLHNMGVAAGQLEAKLAPDAYIIFGSVINDLAGHMGAFAGTARGAANVLAAFATKLTAEINGPLGSQFVAVLANGVKFMIQWGQVLGNLGHGFFDVAANMAGVGHVLLDVLDLLSRAFLALAANPLAEKLIAVAAAMSAVYRYGQLMVVIFRLLVPTALINGIRGLGVALATAATEFVMAGAGADGLRAAVLSLWASMGPVGYAILALGAVMGIWWLATRSTGDATSQLVSNVEKATPSVHSLSGGIGQLTGRLLALTNAYAKVAVYDVGLAQARYLPDIKLLTAAIQKQAQELLNLETGLAQVHAGVGAVASGEAALEIQTALADSKVSQLNQALDQYMQLVTGGTSAMAGFTGALSNLTAGTNTVTTILGRTKSVTLTVQDFARSLDSFSGKGAQAWQNFDQVVGSSAPQLMDWFRQGAVLGAAMGTTVSQAALDMTAMMVRYAGSNKTAQAEVLAFARAQGLAFTSFAALKKAVPSAAAGQADLAKKVDATTIALSDLSQMAKNAADSLNTQMSAAIATSAMKTSGLDAAIQKYQQDVAGGHATRSQLLSDVGAINRDMTIAQQITVRTGNAAGSSFAKITGAADTAKSAMAGTLTEAQRLQAFINGMHGKTIGLHFIITQSGQLTGAGGYAGPGGPGHGVGAIPGAATRLPQRPAFVNPAVHVAVSVPGEGGGGMVVHHHHYNHVEVNNAGSVIAQHDLVRDIVRHLGRTTNRNMSSQVNLPGRVR